MSTDWTRVTATDVFLYAVLIAVAAVFSVVVYRGMQRPRLAVRRLDKGLRATRRDVIRYALTIPPLLVWWWFFFVVVLFISANRLSVFEMLEISGAVVLASRMLAHVWREPAHELSKTIPLTIVTLVLVAGGIRDDDAWDDYFQQLQDLDVTGQALLLLILADYTMTALWYWIGVRWLAAKGRRVPGLTRVGGAVDTDPVAGAAERAKDARDG